EILTLLKPHLSQAYETARELNRLREEMAVLRGGLEASESGLVSLDERAVVRFATPRALRLLGDFFVKPRRGILPEAIVAWLRRGARKPLDVFRDGCGLTIRFLSGSPGPILLLDERWSRIPVSALDALGLSRRESEVLARLAAGETDAAIADVLGLSFRTV